MRAFALGFAEGQRGGYGEKLFGLFVLFGDLGCRLSCPARFLHWGAAGNCITEVLRRWAVSDQSSAGGLFVVVM